MLMVFTKLKPQLDQLSHKEMLKAMAFLKVRLRQDDPDYQRELARRHAEIEAGKGITLSALKRRLKRA